MPDLVCCIDIGTSNIKAALVDDRGAVQVLASAPTPGDPVRTPDRAVDLDGCLTTLGRLTTELLATGAVEPAAVQALVLTGQRATVLALDAAEVPQAVLSWQDVRPTAEVAKLSAEIPAGRFAALTGLPCTAMLSLLKILWLRDRHPELYAASTRYVLVHDYLLRRLGAADHLTDRSNASATGLFDLAGEDWSDEILAAAGLERAQLPTLAPAGSPAGRLSPAAAGPLGLPAGLPLVVGGGDQQCAALGMGLSSPGTAGLCLGTAASVVCPVDRPVAETALGVFCLAHVVPGRWVVEGFFNSFGSTHEWLGQVLAAAPEALDDDRVAAASDPLFLPFLAGIGTPEFDDTLRGALLGLDLSQGAADLVRAGAEGLALEVRRVLEALRLRLPIESLVVAGGGADEQLARRLAESSGLPLSRFANPETALLGAACLAWTALGRYPDLPTASAALSREASAAVAAGPQTPESEARYAAYCSWVETLQQAGAEARGAAGERHGDLPTESELRRIRKEAMEFAQIGIFRYRLDDTIVFMDHGALRILEIADRFPDAAAVCGLKIGELFVYERQPRSLRQRVLESGRVRGVEDAFRTLAGKRKWALHDAYLVEDPVGGEPTIQVITRDITALKRTAEELHETNAALARMNRELRSLDELKSRLLANVSHELRTPLVAVRGFAELIADGESGAVNDTQREQLGVVIRNVDQVVHLVDELLSYARLEQGQVESAPAVLRLNELARTAVAGFAPRARDRSQAITLELDPASPEVWGDARQLTQVLTNLLDNALKFGPAGGTVRVSTRRADPDEVVLAVHDEGPGVPAAERQRVFDRFHQAGGPPGPRSGLGLGLAICQDLVRRHDGRIAITGGPDAGATFEVRLPGHRGGVGHPGARSAEPTPAPAEVPAGTRVLVVDDDPEIVSFLLEALRLRGLQAEAVTDGAQALVRLAGAADSVDVVLLDIAMEGQDGFVVLEQIRAAPATRDLPVLMITAATGADLLARARSTGATALLRKPFAVAELLRQIALAIA